MRQGLYGLVASIWLAPLAQALSGSGVTSSAPVGGGDPGWANVGRVDANGFSCVYLGNYASGFWVLSAAHVVSSDTGSVSINGSSYSMVAGSGVQLANVGNGAYPFADLYLFRVAGDSALALLNNLTVATGAPAAGATLTVIGWGGGTKGYGTVTVPSSIDFGAGAVPAQNIAPGTVSISGSNGASELFSLRAPPCN